jgi:hypothetical protein
MPTPSGKPKRGENVLWVEKDKTTRAVVLQRTEGTSWSLKVRWLEGPVRGRERWITEAQYWMDHGQLRLDL